jgi:hypothetical protein
MPSIRLRELVADALVVVGFVLMVLGIYEIGGLFGLGSGFAVFWLGGLASFDDMRRVSRDEEEAFFRIAEDL